jgi:hypothetical protein
MHMPDLLHSYRRLGWVLGMAAFGLGLAGADPVPIRPYRPQKPAKLPRCPISRGCQPNGPDLTGTAVKLYPLCQPLPQLLEAQLKSGVSPDGKTVVKDVVVEGGNLVRSSAKGQNLAGALLLGKAEGDRTVRLRISSVETAPDPNPQTPANENADVSLYSIDVQIGTGTAPNDGAFFPNKGPSGEWSPLCPDHKQAVVLSGTWDFSDGKKRVDAEGATFACVGSAIAKCVMLMGYKPWKKAALLSGGAAVTFDELHQTCVRAVRADYCGDGESMTRAGERVNFYDRVGIMRDGEDWPLEAQWGLGGALCINTTRLVTAPENLITERPAMKVRDYINKQCPTRFSDKPCDKAASGVLLSTEVLQAKDTGTIGAKRE